MKVLGITGMPWSGKSEAVHIAQSSGAYIIRMGDFVWEEVKKRGLPLTDKHVGYVASEMRERFGADVWAKKTLEAIQKKNHRDFIVIDGIRSIDEVKAFKQALKKNFLLIAITASDTIRHKRAINRKRVDDSTKLAILKKRDQREISWGIKKVIDSADQTIKNETTKQEFKKMINMLLASLKDRKST